MIQSITVHRNGSPVVALTKKEGNRTVIDNFMQSDVEEELEIVFTFAIKRFRLHDYTWTEATTDVSANEFTPKIIQLENGSYVQPNTQLGVWTFAKKRPNHLVWKWNPKNSKNVTQYTGTDNRKVIQSARCFPPLHLKPTLLFGKYNPIEFSRSAIPFAAVACFTDHCDFDTPQNLEVQRLFFKTKGIKITKGFFMNHYSKRNDNASFERESDLISAWHNDGHELCYHSLSQSIKSEKDSFDDFENFSPPYKIPVWIDHGYQPYNLSLFQNCGKTNDYFEQIANQKQLKIFWNYIDSGTSTAGVINQINTNQFTLAQFLKGNSGLGILKKMQLIIKNSIFHYYADERIILSYKNTVTGFRKLFLKKQLKAFPFFLTNAARLTAIFLGLILRWNKHKKTPYRLAAFAPLFFKHRIGSTDFVVFQTLEMTDFKKSLTPTTIDLLIKEKGAFIAHTYFSVPMNYHHGKFLESNEKVHPEVDENFSYLAKQILADKVWNPTLSEWIAYISGFETCKLDVTEDGNFTVIDSSGLLFRTVS